MSRGNDGPVADVGCNGGNLVIRFQPISALLIPSDFKVKCFMKNGKTNFKSKTEISSEVRAFLLTVSKIVGVQSTKCCPIILLSNSLNLHLEKSVDVSRIQPPVLAITVDFLNKILTIGDKIVDEVC